MSAEIYRYYDKSKDGHYEESEIIELGDKGIFWITGYGDGSGNTTCVNVDEGEVEIFNGMITPKDKADDSIQVSIERQKTLASLPSGQPYVGRLLSQQGDIMLFQVRNLGQSSIDPHTRPAWN